MLKKQKWDGPDIPCLKICKEDLLTEATYKVAIGICDLMKDMDLSELTYECIIDQSKIYGKVDFFLLFSILLQNDCDLKDLIDKKADELDTTELLVNNLDLKCLLRSYIDDTCIIVRFYNDDICLGDPLCASTSDPNALTTVFQNSEINNTSAFYISDIDQSVWEYSNLLGYYPSLTGLKDTCICDINSLNLDIKKSLQVIIRNLCQIKSTGIIKTCDSTYSTVVFNTIDPNNSLTIFIGDLPQVQSSYYISSITHKIWRWVPTENSYLPSILSGLNINILDLASCITTQENALQTWIDLYHVYEEPDIISCLSDSPLPTSVHIELITDPAICELKNNIGTAINKIEITSCTTSWHFIGSNPNALIAWDADAVLNTEGIFYTGSNGSVWLWSNSAFQYIPYNPTLSSIEKKQWIKLCDLIKRLNKIEDSCCGPTCDKIKIGYSSIYNSEDNTFTLTFNKASGTIIPTGFTDCGSLLQVTDWKGVSVSYDIQITEETEIEINTSTFDVSKDLIVGIKSCHSLPGIECKQCFSGILPAIGTCGFCKLCARGPKEEKVEIYYYLASNVTNVIHVTVHGGDCITFSLDDLPTITTIFYSSGDVNLENDETHPCTIVELPAPVANTCWFFEVPHSTNVSKVQVNASVGTATIINLDFGLASDLIEDYGKYVDFVNPKGYTINGKIIEPHAINSNSNIDHIVTNVLVPNNLPSNVLSVNVCEAYFHQKWDINGQSGTGALSANNTSGLVIYPLVLNDFKAKYLTTIDDNVTGKFGYVFKVQGQPTALGFQRPEISIVNPINSAVTWIKGQLISDACECPS